MSFETPDVESPEMSLIGTENSSVSVFRRPPNVEGVCTVENQTKRLPVIEDSRTAGKKSFFPIEPPPFSKRAVSLPKLTERFIRKKSTQGADAGEPYSNFLPNYDAEKEDSVTSLDTSAPESLPWDKDSSDSSMEGGLILKQSLHASELNLLKLIKKEEDREFEPSHALQRWEYWLKDKKKIQNYLSRKIKRPPFDLLIQDPDRYREVVQNKRIFSIFPRPDKSRMPVTHWKPERHMSRVKSKERQMQNDTCNSQAIQFEEIDPRDLEYIGVPDKIKVEKGFEYATHSRKKKNLRQKEVLKCHKKIQNLLALNLERRKLVVLGHKINQPVTGNTDTPVQNQPEIITGSVETLDCLEHRQSVFCLLIDGEEIKYEPGGTNEKSRESDSDFTWHVDFGVNTARNISEKALRIENQGTVAVRYQWFSPEKEEKRFQNYLQPTTYESWFFFNKNSGVFLPGQLYELKIYQWAKSAGVRKEKWHLKTEPPLSSSQQFGTVILSAVVTEEPSDLKKNLETYLGRRKTESTVSYIIDVILRKVFRKPEDFQYVEYRTILTDKYQFEYQNPKHFYHSTIVGELCTLFKEISGKSQSDWDLSLDSLIKITLNAKPGSESSAVAHKINNIAKRLLRPNHVMNFKETPKKYKMVRGILCTAIDLLEKDYIFLSNLLLEEPLYKNDCRDYYRRTETEQIEDADWEQSDTAFFNFRTFLYPKIYHRLCEAVECIVGVLETRKLFEPWKKATHLIEKPAKEEVRNLLLDYRLKSQCFDVPPE